jgi:hypothetical protein
VTETIVTPVQTQIRVEIKRRIWVHQNAVAHDASRLNLLCKGDSWFDYPLGRMLPGMRSDIPTQLAEKLGQMANVLNLSHYGDASTKQLGCHDMTMLQEMVTDPANGKFDAILVSAGGDDIVGDQLCIWLNRADEVGKNFQRAINWDRFNAVLDVVVSSYQNLFDFRDHYLPDAPIFSHEYDYPIPDGRGVICVGPWLKPSLELKGWLDPIENRAIVKDMIGFWGRRLGLMARDKKNNFEVVKTAGVLQANQWANELHPTEEGFGVIADLYIPALAQKFPDKFT